MLDDKMFLFANRQILESEASICKFLSLAEKNPIKFGKNQAKENTGSGFIQATGYKIALFN